MMLKVFPDDDLGSTAHDRKKEQEKGIHMTPISMMPSISMLALPGRGNVFVLGADTSRVGIGITLMQDGTLGPKVYAGRPWQQVVAKDVGYKEHLGDQGFLELKVALWLGIPGHKGAPNG
ncbi:hypothetical protein BHM03_00005479 [Ensete ventricosum]|uniref:Uncharacterized protein n=1 Tax=Ensete ventricosum TaxID=4639 RepID=A0A445MBD9_ENSVE|nr:hypothetical protein BHM03_00005479 [Ensete ventricosum]